MTDPSSQETPVVGGFSADRSDAISRLRTRRSDAPAATIVAKTPTALLFVLVVAAGGAFFLQQQRAAETREQENLQLREELESLRSALSKVSREINVTGESLSEAGSATEQKLRFLDSEIRKLWVVSNERNKKAIAEQKAALNKLSDELEKRQGGILAARKQADQAEARVNEQQVVIDKLTARVGSLEKSLQKLRESASAEKQALMDRELALQTRVDQVSAQLGALGEQVKQAVQQTQTFSERLQTNQQDIRAVDAFRKQTNRALTSLQATVNEMQQDLDAMKRVY